MAIGDNTDMWGRLKKLLPVGWFGDNNPIRDALLWGYANVLAWGYTLYLYAKDQTRIKSATDGWLDLIGLDFFGNNLVRYANQSDASYKNRILINIFRERTTRHAMEQVLYDLTGRWPIIVEPARPADVGSYGAAVAVTQPNTTTMIVGGKLVYVPPNTPRYQNNVLLIEEQKTNGFTYSEDFLQSAWVKLNTTIGPGVKQNPAATAVMPLVTGSSAGNSYLYRPVNVTGAYTITLFVSSGTLTSCRLYATAPSAQALYTLVGDGTAVLIGSPPPGTAATITKITTDLYRISLTVVLSGVGNVGLLIDVGTLSIWGAQLESGSTLTSYIPTLGSSVLRAADILLNNMPSGSIAIGGYGVVGAYGSILLPYQAFITAFRPMGQGLPFVSGYDISTGAYSTPSQSAYGQLSGGDVTDADIYAAIDATKPIGTVAWTSISS